MVIQTMSRLDVGGVRSQKPSKRCAAKGCNNTTRESKPYCPDHVEQHSYVTSLMSQLAERESEEAAVAKKGAKAIQEGSLAVQEILTHITQMGQRTVPRLARDLNMPVEVLEPYVAYMTERGMLLLGKTTRGSSTVRLPR